MSITDNYPLQSISLTAQSAGVPQVVQVGLNLTDAWVKVYNESPFQLLAISGAGATLHEISAQSIDAFYLPAGSRLFTLTPLGIIPGTAPSYTVRMSLYMYGPPPGAYPQALPRQTSSVQPAVRFAYSAAAFTPGTATYQLLNIFNPLNSGKDYTVYSALGVITTGTAVTEIAAEILAGPDANVGTGVAVNAHDSLAPASLAHVTVGSGSLPGNTVLSTPTVSQTQVNVPGQLQNNGDLSVIHPGQNFLMIGNTNSQVMLGDLAWYEQ